MISIIMATYNGSHYLKEQLESIANQTIKPEEIVIVDDCSADNTIEIIENFKRNNKDFSIKLILNEKNMGPAISFAKGVLESKGDFIFFCDQDDIWFENKIEEVLTIFKNNPKIKMLCTGYHLYDDKNKKVIKDSRNSGEVFEISLSKVLKGNISPGCTVAFSGMYRDKAKLINERIFIHDWFYSIISAVDSGLYYYCKPLIYYRIHSNNTIGKNLSFYPKYSREKRIKSIERHIQFYEELISLNIFNDKNSKEIGNMVNELIEINHIRLNLLNRNIGYVSYLNKIYNLKNNINIKSVIGDLIYARKKN
ncbi:glycosyltransferase [Bacillus paranthracis]|uniref:glycosyltransferase n=1 Tax=Bacillus paranthracis TaxID=2026186 RepID=UPI00298BF1A0|nr:glycosyltransferase [Bacillus paranthracis]